MGTSFAQSFYNSKSWKQCRKSYVASVNGLCERCLENGMVKGGFILHHIEHITPQNMNNPNITLNFDNLQFLCLECHNTIHSLGHKAVVEGISFDEQGNVVKEE